MDVKKGTTTLGIICKDGVVLAADRRATAGNLIVDKNAKKVQRISDNAVCTIAGTVSDAMLIIKWMKAEISLKNIRAERASKVHEIANLLSTIVYNNIRKMSMIPGIAHFVLAGFDNEGCHLYDIFPDGSATKIKNYVSSGSGSVFVYGVLETEYRADLTVEEGVKLAVKAISAAMERDNATGNGMDVVTIVPGKVEFVLREAVTLNKPMI